MSQPHENSFFGATVTSWKVNGQERLFVSSKSALDKSKPVSLPPEVRRLHVNRDRSC